MTERFLSQGGAGLPGSGSGRLGPAGNQLQAGAKLGRYELVHEIGQGGMGVVWLARDPLLAESVALKFLPYELANDAGALHQLREEAKVMRALTHEGIVRLHTFEMVSGLAFLVEEYLSGGSLYDVMAKRRLSVDEAIWVLEEIAPSLDYAHMRKVTHRDIKPSNLLLTEAPAGELGAGAERLKVADFGLAFVASSAMSTKSNYNPSGTLPYMSPEVLMGHKPAPPADIYSLGISLYELVSGRLPFCSGDIPTQILQKRPGPLNSGDAALDATVARALAKKPVGRPTSAGAMVAMVLGPEEGEEGYRKPRIDHRRRARRRTLRSWMQFVGTVVVVALGATVGLKLRAKEPSEAAVVPEPLPGIQVDGVVESGQTLHRRSGFLSLSGSVVHAREDDVRLWSEGSNSARLPLGPASGPQMARSFRTSIKLGSSCDLLLDAEGVDEPYRIAVIVDDTPPMIEILEPIGETVYTDSVSVRVRVMEPQLERVVLNDVPMRRVEGDIYTGPPVQVPGVLQVVAVDRAGNVGRSRIVNVRKAPGIKIRCNPLASLDLPRWYSVLFDFSFDPPATSFSVDATEVALESDGTRASIELLPPREGATWQLQLKATDPGGREFSKAVVYSISEPARPLPEGFFPIDSTKGEQGFVRAIQHREIPGLEFLLVPSGTFTMGAPEGVDARWWESGARHVEIAHPFYLSRTEVTLGQFRAWLGQTQYIPTYVNQGGLLRPGGEDRSWRQSKHATPTTPLGEGHFDHTTHDSHPVTQVSFWDAVEFCRAHGLRLPTEAEWEYVCQAGDPSWWKADEPNCNLGGGVLPTLDAEGEPKRTQFRARRYDPIDPYPFTNSVELFQPNPWGFRGLLGNVREWTLDVFSPSVLAKEAGVDPWEKPGPSPPNDKPREVQSLRGGDWMAPPKSYPMFARSFEPGETAMDVIGFRVVYDPFGRHALPDRDERKDGHPEDDRDYARYGEDGQPLETWTSWRKEKGYRVILDDLAEEEAEPAVRTWTKHADPAVQSALAWLRAHQDKKGFWDCDGFAAACAKRDATVCEGEGQPAHDVGVTSLALLAFLRSGSSLSNGPDQALVRRTVDWLIARQAKSTGLLGDDSVHNFIYNHALATLALAEVYRRGPRRFEVRRALQRGVDYIERARNPYRAWRYEVPPIGDNDVSVTGWMLGALLAAKSARIEVDEEAIDGGLSFIDEFSDLATGRVGYHNFGSLSSRTPANEHYPREQGEAMTAVGLLCRLLVGQDPDKNDMMRRHADLILKSLPHWDPEGFGCDLYYWYYGTRVASELGGSFEKRWDTATTTALLDNQDQKGDRRGSWPPVGPWGYSGGRVYATALCALMLMEL